MKLNYDMIPQKTKNVYAREERDKTLTVSGGFDYLHLSKFSTDLFLLIDGNTNIGEIVKVLVKIYSKATTDEVVNKISEQLTYFRNNFTLCCK